jgi:hypothetical protein
VKQLSAPASPRLNHCAFWGVGANGQDDQAQ